jgi:hypothetical protein
MQTTDILSLTLSALANAGKVSPAIDERVQLNLASDRPDFAPVEFVDGEETLTFPGLLDRHRGRAFGLTAVPLPASDLPPTVTAGFEGTSRLAFAVQHEAVYSPVIYFPPETTLTAAQIDAFLSERKCREYILSRIALDLEVPGPLAADRQRELSLAFSNIAVSDADRHAWHDLVQRHYVRLPARFVFRRQPQLSAAIERPTFPEAYTALREALMALAAFADRTDQRDWAGHFRGSIAQLSLAPDPQPLYGILAECGRPPAAIRLLNAAQMAWVFGGMGSWNDAPTAGSEEHERLSTTLLDAITLAILAAANTD